MKRSIVFALLMALVASTSVHADLWEDGGFEGSLGWNGSAGFATASNMATEGAEVNGATRYTLVHDDLLTESGKWVEDPTRAFEGNRMFWLRPYDDPDTICVGHRLTNILNPGTTYELKFNLAAFDENVPAGSTAITKPVTEITAWDPNSGTDGAFVTSELPVSFSDGQTRDPVANTFGEFQLQDWDNLSWTTATTIFTAPESNGQSIYVWTSMTNDSAGMLLDGITLRAVPEPSTGIVVAAMGLLGLLIRRRGKSQD